MNASIKDKWHVFQIHVSQLLSQWMEFNRHPELYEQFAPGSSLPAQEIQASNVPCMVQFPLLGSVSHCRLIGGPLLVALPSTNGAVL